MKLNLSYVHCSSVRLQGLIAVVERNYQTYVMCIDRDRKIMNYLFIILVTPIVATYMHTFYIRTYII